EVLDRAGVDVIIAGRGGGSIEDLWAFNERIVAEAIFNAKTPVISAVGHETDTTIADFAADLRAPTPSAAAELAVYDYGQYLEGLDACRSALKDAIGNHIMRSRLRLKETEAGLKRNRPDAVIAAKKMRLLDIDSGLRQLMNERLIKTGERLAEFSRRLPDTMHGRLKESRHDTALYAERLKGVSPLEKLTQGYSYVSDEKGKNIRDVSGLSEGDRINIYMLNGRVKADVAEVDRAVDQKETHRT
ncbi:MAG: exodeoxyribonuclease VII large subunit, partial [Lachnospiraceae bacterium]|nr:exodeoxyribonuclease VII large subunit [Lachnospiraceae bacterium]